VIERQFVSIGGVTGVLCPVFNNNPNRHLVDKVIRQIGKPYFFYHETRDSDWIPILVEIVETRIILREYMCYCMNEDELAMFLLIGQSVMLRR
jgi:hypothetical protein